MTAENRPATRDALPCGCAPPAGVEWIPADAIEREPEPAPAPRPGWSGWFRQVAATAAGDTSAEILERIDCCPTCGASLEEARR